MTALAAQRNSQPNDKNITSINANARIDYILKFSRHVVVVIDDLNQGFGAISGSYLATLPETANASLVTVSNKLNDVQVRARINEQLFPGQPFDPEIALTQSVSEHYHTSNSPVAIVIEQAHHLSLQIIHELTLLAEIAKKAGRDIQIVLLGEIEIGRIIANNYSLFNKKLSMLSAHSGQLITANADLLKAKGSFLALTPFNKLVLGLVLALAITFVGLFFMYQRDSLQFSQLPSTESAPLTVTKPEAIVTPALTEVTEQATPKEVLSALNVNSMQPDKVVYAQPSDILLAINAVEQNTNKRGSEEIEQSDSSVLQTNTINVDTVVTDNIITDSLSQPLPSIEQQPIVLDAYGFNNETTGVVIQFAALEVNEGEMLANVVDDFVNRFYLNDYKYYSRFMNGKAFVVITSGVYQERKLAADAMLELPTELQNSGIWLKSVETIHKEMAVVLAQ